MPNTTPSHLQRASSGVALQHGDLVGQRAQLLAAEQKDRAEQLERVITELRSPDTQLVWISIPGRSGEWPLPKEVANYLAATKRSTR